tara:strand:+ start:342 stop:815 length:474 start_codon:yes stop_codon:yes gene_type:complete
MAIGRFHDRKGNADFDKLVHTGDHENPMSKMLTEIANKLDELVDKINTVDTATNANTAKTSFPGFGTTSTTALAGDTTTISTAQARDITSGALIDAKLNVTKVQANLSKSTAITFGEFTTTTTNKGTTYSLPITVVETTIAKGGNTTITKTGVIPLI